MNSSCAHHINSSTLYRSCFCLTDLLIIAFELSIESSSKGKARYESRRNVPMMSVGGCKVATADAFGGSRTLPIDRKLFIPSLYFMGAIIKYVIALLLPKGLGLLTTFVAPLGYKGQHKHHSLVYGKIRQIIPRQVHSETSILSR